MTPEKPSADYPDATDSPADNSPLSPAKLAANRANALKSTGPTTPEGKAVCARNAIKHGAYTLRSAQPDEQQDLLSEMDLDSHVERIPRMQPATEGKPLSPEDRRLATHNIKQYVLAKKLISISQLARMAGVSSSSVSELLAGKYKGDADAILRKCDSAIADYARREDAPDAAQFVRTRFAERIFAILKLASKMRTMAAFYCVSGTGKSMALKAALRLDFQTAIYLECNAGSSSPLHLLQALLNQLNLRGITAAAIRDKGAAFNLIVEKLVNTGRMLLIDEADCLPPKSLNVLRQIYDATTGHRDNPCPIVLAGRPNLRESIDRTVRCPEIGGSLRGRISIEHNLMPAAGTNPADGGAWLFSVEEILAMLAKRRITITREAARWLCCLANISLLAGGREDGGPRLAIKVAVNAATLSKQDGPLEFAQLKRAYRLARDREGALMTEELIEGALKYAPLQAATA